MSSPNGGSATGDNASLDQNHQPPGVCVVAGGVCAVDGDGPVAREADRVSDDEAYLAAHEIAKRVSNEMTFPGEIKVTVLRETRAIELAR